MTDLTAALAEIRRRYSMTNYAIATEGHILSAMTASTSDVPRLLAALDAVLEMHKPGRIVVTGTLCNRHEANRYFSITRTEAADVEACADCAATIYHACAGCDSNPWLRWDECPIREAISRALLGEDGN